MFKNILLTGAAGTVGTPTLIELINKNYNIRVLEKPLPPQRTYQRKLERFNKLIKQYSDKIEVHWGDITDYPTVKNAVKDMDAVIHLAAVIPPLSEENPTLAEKVNINGTENIINAMKETGVNRLIFTSSVAVYGDRRRSPWIKSTDPLTSNPPDTYTKTKIQCEKIIESSNLDWTIFRLGAVFIKSFDIDFKTFQTALTMPLDTYLEWISAEDCAHALVEALNHPELVNGKYNLGGGAKCRVMFKEFLGRLLPILGYSNNLLPAEAFETSISHGGYFNEEESEWLQKILGHQRTCLEDYYKTVGKTVNPVRRSFRRFSLTLFKPFIREYIRRRVASNVN
ncbi:MAG: NAD(P)-dependent oxidoreductase [Candidatus Odinarchaeota archaeon]